MADIFTREKRSEIMSRVRSKNTKAELLFRKALSAKVYPEGLRYRLHYKKTSGSPDIVFVSRKVAIFVDGDFWHGRNYGKDGKSRFWKKFWRDKIETNIRRDRRIDGKLKRDGWKVVHLWESDLKKDMEKCLARVMKKLI